MVYSIFSQLALSVGHLYNNFGTKRWPSDKASHDKLLYVIQEVESIFLLGLS